MKNKSYTVLLILSVNIIGCKNDFNLLPIDEIKTKTNIESIKVISEPRFNLINDSTIIKKTKTPITAKKLRKMHLEDSSKLKLNFNCIDKKNS